MSVAHTMTIAELRAILAEAKRTYLAIRQREEIARREVEACERERYGLYDTAYTTWSMLRKLGDPEQGELLGLEDTVAGGGTRTEYLAKRSRDLLYELKRVAHDFDMVFGDDLTSVRS